MAHPDLLDEIQSMAVSKHEIDRHQIDRGLPDGRECGSAGRNRPQDGEVRLGFADADAEV